MFSGAEMIDPDEIVKTCLAGNQERRQSLRSLKQWPDGGLSAGFETLTD